MNTTTPSKASTTSRREKRQKAQKTAKVVKLYFPFIPPAQPEVYEVDELLEKAFEWREKEDAKDRASSLKLLHNLQKAGLLEHAVILDHESYEAIDPQRVKDLLEEDSVLHASHAFEEAGDRLVRFMRGGNATAASKLWQGTVLVTAWLQRYYRLFPELFLKHAKLAAQMPVLATLHAGWENHVRTHMAVLQLGSGLASSHLKPIAYKTKTHVCRAWAARAIQTLDHNRHLKKQVDHIHQFLKQNPRPAISFSCIPGWVSEAETLEPFSEASLKKWVALMRLMLAEQMPDIAQHADFKTLISNIRTRIVEKTGEAKDTDGRVRHALLDQIASAMRSIARFDT